MWNYQQFNDYLGKKEDRPIPKMFGSPRATRIVRLNNYSIAVRYHYTNVVILHSNGDYTLNTGGWESVTTKKRINDFSPLHVYQRDRVWYYGDDKPFKGGMRINRRGTVVPNQCTTNNPQSADDIPHASYYITCDDSFMSHWGKAEGKINTLILPCADIKEAEQVCTNAESRGDQTNIRYSTDKPRLNIQTHFYSLHDRYDYRRWYE